MLDESNGCGDAFLLHGEGPGMVGSAAAVEAYMASQPCYKGTQVHTRGSMRVHSIGRHITTVHCLDTAALLAYIPAFLHCHVRTTFQPHS